MVFDDKCIGLDKRLLKAIKSMGYTHPTLVQVDNSKKDEMIESFYMLSDEDKLDVITHKNEYSVDEIEAKLSVIAWRKKANFSVEEKDEAKVKQEKPVLFNLVETEVSALPAYLQAVVNNRNKN